MPLDTDTPDAPVPEPATDWIDRTELARMLGISHQTAYRYERAGEFERFKHKSPVATRNRRFSRLLVERHVRECLRQIMERYSGDSRHVGAAGTTDRAR